MKEMNLKRMRQKKNSRIINEERIKTITRDFKLKNSIKMNWMIYLNYELILGSLSQALKILNEKRMERIKKEMVAMRVQKIWKIYNVLFFLNF